MGFRMLLILLASAMVCTLSAAPLGTAFTYQGVLSDAGSPAAGVFDFQFILYDAEVGGSQVGSILEVEDVTVTDGRVTTVLDFGAVFSSDALWLDVGVRDGALTGSYTVLSPRQRLTPTPFAQRTTTAGDADLLGGQVPSYYLEWSNLSNVPQGLDDGDDDVLGGLSCSSGEVAKWDGAAWQCDDEQGVSFSSTYVVGPVGTPTQNGAALLNALAVIPAVSGPGGALLKIEPGEYDLAGGQIVMKERVDIEGSGDHVWGRTSISSERCGGGDLQSSAVVVAGYLAELRDVRVSNTCADNSEFAVGIFNSEYSASLKRVFVSILNPFDPEPWSSWGIYNTGVRLRVSEANIIAYGTFQAQGIYSTGNSLELDRVVVTGRTESGLSGGGIQTLGIESKFTDVEATGYGGSGGTGGISGNGEDATFRNVTASVENAVASAIAIRLEDPDGLSFDAVVANGNHTGVSLVVPAGSPATTYDVAINNLTATGSSVGLSTRADSGSIAVYVRNSVIQGTTNTFSSFGSTIDITTTQLQGGAVDGTGYTCAAVYDEALTFFPSTCP